MVAQCGVAHSTHVFCLSPNYHDRRLCPWRGLAGRLASRGLALALSVLMVLRTVVYNPQTPLLLADWKRAQMNSSIWTSYFASYSDQASVTPWRLSFVDPD